MRYEYTPSSQNRQAMGKTRSPTGRLWSQHRRTLQPTRRFLADFQRVAPQIQVRRSDRKNVFKQVKTPQPSTTPVPNSPSSVISVEVGHNILLTIRAGESVP